MKCQFYQVDVFTDTPFGGNPLAVFINNCGLTNDTMQKIAKEMNLSETTFVCPPGKSPVDYSIRIFTPEKELPFAGHPTLGTAHILREKGKVPSGEYQIKFLMKAGVITVAPKNGNSLLFMSQLLPDYKLPLNHEKKISDVLGIPPSAINSTYPIQIVSTGLPVLIVPIVSMNSLKKIRPDNNRLKQILTSLGLDMINTFTMQTIHSNSLIHSRVFAPGMGILEDPATGSAAGAMGSYLFKNNVVSKNVCKNICIEQGYLMGRPSTLYVEVEQENNKIKTIRVGGESVTVLEGWFNVGNFQ